MMTKAVYLIEIKGADGRWHLWDDVAESMEAAERLQEYTGSLQSRIVTFARVIEEVER